MHVERILSIPRCEGVLVTLGLIVLTRDGEQVREVLEDGEERVFGRAGRPGTVVISASSHVSRSAFRLRAERGGFARVLCAQRQGTVEVKRADGRVAASLNDGEEGLFRAPVSLSLHTATGAQATIAISPDRPSGPIPAPGRASDPGSTATVGWSVAMIQDPPGGQDWYVAAAMGALLLRRGRRTDPGYTVPRGVLLRACGQWLGTPKSEGWLASKFKQAGEALAVRFENNPSQLLAEYVLANRLINDAALQHLDVELERRRQRG